MLEEIHLRTKIICIPLVSMFTSYFPKEQFRLLNLKIFQTEAISYISSQNHKVMIGLEIYFR